MITSKSFGNPSGTETVLIKRGTMLAGIGRVKPGDVQEVPATVARLLFAAGQAVPHTLERKASRKKASDAD